MPAKVVREGRPGPRPFWSGTLTFGLVSLPVEIYPVVRPTRVPMKMLGPDGTPLKRRYFCTADGKELNSKEIIRGYELADGRFVVVTDKDLEALAPRKSRDIDLRRFVDRNAIPLPLLEHPYVLAPGGESTKAYHLLVETMERTEKAGIATFVMRGKEHLAAIFSERGLLLAVMMRFADELRSPEDIGLPEVRPAPAKLKREAVSALKKLAKKDIDRSLLQDVDSAALLALAERKKAEKRDIVEVSVSPSEHEDESADVIDIMSLLKSRMRQGGDAERTKAAKSKSDPLETSSKEELYQRAQALEVPGRSKMSKDELIAAIQAAA